MNNNIKRWENLTMGGSTLQCQVSWYLSGWCDLYGMVLLWHIYGEGVTKWSPQQSKQLWCNRDHLVGKLRGGWFFSANIAMLAKIDPWQPFSENPSVLIGRGVPNLVVSGFFKIVLFRVPYKHLAFAKVDPTACPIVHGWMDEWMDTTGRCGATIHQPMAQWKAQCRLVLCLHLISSCFLCSFVKKVLLFSTAVYTFTDNTFAHLPIVCRRVLASRVYCRHGCRSLLGAPPPASKEIRITQSPSSYLHSSQSSSSTIQILPVLHQKGQNHRTISSWDNENLITRPMLHSNQLDFGRDAAGRERSRPNQEFSLWINSNNSDSLSILGQSLGLIFGQYLDNNNRGLCINICLHQWTEATVTYGRALLSCVASDCQRLHDRQNGLETPQIKTTIYTWDQTNCNSRPDRNDVVECHLLQPVADPWTKA